MPRALRGHRIGDVGFHHYAFELRSRRDVDELETVLRHNRVTIVDPGGHFRRENLYAAAITGGAHGRRSQHRSRSPTSRRVRHRGLRLARCSGMAERSEASALRRAIANPRSAWHFARGLARGWVCVAWHRVRGVRLQVGRGLRVDGWLSVRGPGRVVLGDHVRIAMLVTPWTTHPDATIEIGSHTFLNGARFSCQQSIRVGARSIIANASILDCDFHSTCADRHAPDAPVRTAPVVLDENVWVAGQAGLLPGTRIGRNSVVGFGAVCTAHYPEDVIIAGNPARVVGPLPSRSEAEARSALRVAG
jgi:acetyltransferase-like isoleucine patch superfamily enzyme